VVNRISSKIGIDFKINAEEMVKLKEVGKQIKRVEGEMNDLNRILKKADALRAKLEKSTKSSRATAKAMTKAAEEILTKYVPSEEGDPRLGREFLKRYFKDKVNDHVEGALATARVRGHGDLKDKSDKNLKELFRDLMGAGIDPVRLGIERPDFFKREISRLKLKRLDITASELGRQEKTFRDQIGFSLRDPDAVVRQMNAIPTIEKMDAAYFGLAEAEKRAAEELRRLNEEGHVFEMFFKKTGPALKKMSNEMQGVGEQGGILTTIFGNFGQIAQEVSGKLLGLARSPAPQEFSDNWSRGFNFFASNSQSATRTATTAFQNFAGGARSAISNSLFSLLRGDMKSFAGIWKNFAGSLLDTFTKLASNSIFGLFGLGSGGGGLESLLSGDIGELFGLGGSDQKQGGGLSLGNIASIGKNVVSLFGEPASTFTAATLNNILAGAGVDAASSLASLFGVSSAGTISSSALAAVNAELAASSLFTEFTGTAIASGELTAALEASAAAATATTGALSGLGLTAAEEAAAATFASGGVAGAGGASIGGALGAAALPLAGAAIIGLFTGKGPFQPKFKPTARQSGDANVLFNTITNDVLKALGLDTFESNQFSAEAGKSLGAQTILDAFRTSRITLDQASTAFEQINAFNPLEGDGVGRFLQKPSLRLVGEAGPEHILNVDSGPSIRALTEGIRPIIRELFEEERRGGGGRQDIHIHMEGAIIGNRRGLEWLARQLDDIRAGRRVSRGRFA
jgi:hypothetical protein